MAAVWALVKPGWVNNGRVLDLKALSEEGPLVKFSAG
jgi:hypothetical protein